MENNQLLTNLELKEHFVEASGVTKVISMTESEYNSLVTKEPTTLYVVIDDEQVVEQPLTFDILTDGTIIFTEWIGNLHKTLQYSINGGPWSSITSTGGYPSFDVHAGDSVAFVGDTSPWGVMSNETVNNWCVFGGTAYFNARGNIMSVVGYTGDPFLPGMFYSNGMGPYPSRIIDASGLIFPSTVVPYSFHNMFYDNQYIKTAPRILPAMTLAKSCYSQMFSECLNLETAPELPATELADGCYGGMFRMGYLIGGNNNVLTTAPVLPATVLKPSCYYRMFNGCAALSYIKCMSAAGDPDRDYASWWTAGVAPTGTFVKASGSTWESGPSGIPTGWTVNEEEIPAEDYSKKYLTLEIVTSGTLWLRLPYTEGAMQCRKNNGSWVPLSMSDPTYNPGTEMVSLGAVYPGDTIELKCDGSLGVNVGRRVFSGDTTYNVYGNIQSMVYGDNFSGQTSYFNGASFFASASTVSAENLILPNVVSNDQWYKMFDGCTGLTKAPVLTPTALTSGCYEGMFRNCTSLSWVKCLAVTGIDTNYSTNNWMINVPASGTFVKAAGVTWPTGNNGIPSGWSVQEE